MSSDQSRRKVAAETGIFLLVVAAIVVAVNVFAAGANARYDATANERYTLSEGSSRLVNSLKEPMIVDAYVTRGLAKLEVFVDDLSSLLKEYERTGGGKFKFNLIEAKTDEMKERAKEAGLTPMAFAAQAETGDDQAAIAQGYLGLVFKYGSEKGTLPLAPNRSEGLEFQITGQIRELRDKADDIKHKIGVVIGKEELKLDDTNLVPKRGGQGGPNMKGVIQNYFPFYEFVDVDLKNGDEEIPADLDGLIITQPQSEYVEKELRRVDQFLMLGGKSVAVFASAVNIKPSDPKMEATLDTKGLDKLLAGYGINIKKDLLLDFGAQFQTAVPTQGGLAIVRHPPLAQVVDDPRFEGDTRLLDTGFASFFRLQEMAFPYPSSLEILRDKQPADVSIKVVARTTPNTSELVFDGKQDLSLRLKGWEPKPDPQQHPIAAVAEGKLKSAFPDGDDQGIDKAEVAPEVSRILVIASSQYLTNPFAYSGNGPDLGGQFQMMGNVGGDPTLLAVAEPYANRYLTNTVLSFKNTLDWITGDQDLIAVSAKIIASPNLRYTKVQPSELGVSEEELRKADEDNKRLRRKIQQQVQWTLTLGIPFLFGAFGVWRWRRRGTRGSHLTLA
jgi:ABC-type uncharacterized transport system involved in gliding motility auxiliary subunit